MVSTHLKNISQIWIISPNRDEILKKKIETTIQFSTYQKKMGDQRPSKSHHTTHQSLQASKSLQVNLSSGLGKLGFFYSETWKTDLAKVQQAKHLDMFEMFFVVKFAIP